MKQATTLRAIEANADHDVIVPGNAEVKTLDSHFLSFGDALYSWTNTEGFEKTAEKCADNTMVRAFCTALKIPFVIVSDNILDNTHYFESDAWAFAFVEQYGFVRFGRGQFFKIDEYNRPIAIVSIGRDPQTNVQVEYCGAEWLALEFREVLKMHVKVDPKTEEKATYAEVVTAEGLGRMMGGGSLACIKAAIDNPRVALPEYYPYLDGGIEALLREFIESDESVLILMGPAGTGKSSAVASAVENLRLLPIYAKRADVIHDKTFVNFVFKTSDEYMAKIAGTSAKARADLFQETLVKDREFTHSLPLSEKKEEKEEPRVPVIIVEDADILLAPRSTGNLMMPELLNETDGIGSNHTRKIIFTTNLSNTKAIDEALMRPGRCFDVVNCRLLTPTEAVAARRANGLPDFAEVPTSDVSLAEALRKPRKKIVMTSGKASLGFNTK